MNVVYEGGTEEFDQVQVFYDRLSYLVSSGDVPGVPNRRKSNSAFRNKAVFVTWGILSPSGVGL